MPKSMKRIPVTRDSFNNRISKPSVSNAELNGMSGANVKVGKIDATRAKYAAQGSGKTAGWGVGDVWHTSGQSYGSSYRSSYANSGNSAGAFGDVPLYFALMNENNGGILYWPVNLREKFSWYRYFVRCIYLQDNELAYVLMANGTHKDIRTVTIGEEVITANGSIKKVRDVFTKQTKGNAVKIDWYGSYTPTTLTFHHPLYVMDENNKMVKKLACDITEDDYLVSKISNYVVDSDLNEYSMKLLGYYVSEGSLVSTTDKVAYRKKTARNIGELSKTGLENQTDYADKHYKAVRFTIHEDELDTIGKEIAQLSEILCKKSIKIYRTKRLYKGREDKTVEIRIYDVDLATFCLKHGGLGANNKTLSRDVVFASSNLQYEFLRTYISGDGEKNKRGICRISTTSFMLAQQVQFMLYRIGISSYLKQYVNKKGVYGCVTLKEDKCYYHISISKFEYEKFSKVRSIMDYNPCCRLFIKDGYIYSKIKHIEKINDLEGIVWNISVDSDVEEERSYLLNGFVGSKNTDPFVGQAVDLHSELPLSKLILKMPEMKDKKRKKYIQKKYEQMISRIKLFENLQSIVREWLVIGNVYLFFEYDEENKEWKKMVMLPPEEVGVFRYPFSDESRIEYNPGDLLTIVKKIADLGLYDKIRSHKELKNYLEDGEYKAISHIPLELIQHVMKNEKIIMDTSPYSGDEDVVGSYVYHMARCKVPYEDLGVSILERVLTPLLMKEHYKYTQLSLASRNMTPRNKISAPEIDPIALDELREQVDLSMLDPDYSIVTNYEWSWEQIGADHRLIDLQREYETIENQLFAGLGVTKELLTGEGQYSGSKITVEIMNTRYMLMRDILRNMVEDNIFKPIAEANGFYDIDEHGFKTYYYPHLSFNRLTIRDNQEVFDSLFQLYQKGSLPVDTILELFNIDSDEVAEKLRRDQFTLKDSTYNDFMRSVYVDVAMSIAQNSDLAKRMALSISGPDGKPLNYKEPEGEGGMPGMGGDMAGMPGDAGAALSDDDIEDMATDTASVIEQSLPAGATAEDVETAIEELKTEIGAKSDGASTPEQQPVDQAVPVESGDAMADNDLDAMADDIVRDIKEEIPHNMTEEDIEAALNKLRSGGDLKEAEADEDDMDIQFDDDNSLDRMANDLYSDIRKKLPGKFNLRDLDNALNDGRKS